MHFMRQMAYVLTALAALFTFNSSSYARGVALCVEVGNNAKGYKTDVEYFLRWGGDPETTGRDVQKAARHDQSLEYSGTASCRNNERYFLDGGWFVVIKAERSNRTTGRKSTYALGYGQDHASAVLNAIEELKRRDWSWRREHGYIIDTSKAF